MLALPPGDGLQRDPAAQSGSVLYLWLYRAVGIAAATPNVPSKSPSWLVWLSHRFQYSTPQPAPPLLGLLRAGRCTCSEPHLHALFRASSAPCPAAFRLRHADPSSTTPPCTSHS